MALGKCARIRLWGSITRRMALHQGRHSFDTGLPQGLNKLTRGRALIHPKNLAASLC
jgi:hypothetical protein